MNRYVAYTGWDPVLSHTSDKTLVVHEQEQTPVYTGLLNKDGVRLYRVAQPAPLGFFDFGKRRPDAP